MKLDSKDKRLLHILQQNGRESLTNLAKAINLSIDSTHKRLKKLQERGIITRFGIFIDPKALGYEFVADVRVKLQNISEEEFTILLNYLKAHPNVIELITTLGDFDVTCALIARNTQELESISREIRQRFRNLIDDWKSVISLQVYKFEEYGIEVL